MLPEHLHGWKSGCSGDASHRQTLQISGQMQNTMNMRMRDKRDYNDCVILLPSSSSMLCCQPKKSSVKFFEMHQTRLFGPKTDYVTASFGELNLLL